ncbi:DUF5805 domain-containing protein [Natronosalvus halobius]|uniref:DUF5805 domain-containing protein n=1 Tax=Natronosalvus halobius TaxID=2953746 RepID=UPI0020A053F1|nr:DUF5805 domain-containing protein [Natronosalvus halobius]USZ72905.1 DUF5805 domain-containing protein [Natronosalvus halobius]
MSDDPDSETVVVRTYVPRYQKENWATHADELDMSQSEYVRSMVQSGRKGFESLTAETPSPDATPGGSGLETQVLDLLRSGTYSWEELLDAVSDDIESQLDETLERLQATNRVRYSGRHGGYTLSSDTDGN